jgi:hypothetical protein
LISRTLVIVLAFVAAGMRASQGAWVETVGLVGLAAGLICLQSSERRPAFKIYAWMCFAITAMSMAIVFWRMYR